MLTLSDIESAETYLVYVIAAIASGATVLLAVLFTVRVKKSIHLKRVGLLRNRLRKVINKIIIHDNHRASGVNSAAFEFYLAELRLILSDSRAKRQVLIREIMDMKRYLTGSSSDALIAVYNELGLYKDSIRKLKALGWQEKALGIRELAEMGYSPATAAILRFLASSNPVLRQESLLALVRLEEATLSFLTNYHDHLSKWMQVNIYHFLSKFDVRKLPEFRQWFNHRTSSVRCFSITMAYHFRQTNAIPGLSDLLYDPDPEVVSTAACALGELEAFEHRGQIVKLAKHCWKYHNVLLEALRCLARIGDPDEDAELVGTFLKHPNYAIRCEAAATLRHFTITGDNREKPVAYRTFMSFRS